MYVCTWLCYAIYDGKLKKIIIKRNKKLEKTNKRLLCFSLMHKICKQFLKMKTFEIIEILEILLYLNGFINIYKTT